MSMKTFGFRHFRWYSCLLVIHLLTTPSASQDGGDVFWDFSFPADSPIECSAPADVVIILDASSSVGTANFKKVLEFVVGTMQDADIDGGAVRLAVMSFSSEATVHFYLNTHSTAAKHFAAIRTIPYISGSSNTADALRTLRTEVFNIGNGDRPEVPDVAVIITDGISNLNSERTIPEAVITHASGIHIFVIGIGLTGNIPEILALATPPAVGNRYLVKTFDDLQAIRRNMFAKICEMAVIDLPPDLKSGYGTIANSGVCLAEADLVFLLDSSSSVGEPNFQ